jgi:hypothetical protein
MRTARLFLTNCLIWLLTLAGPAGVGAVTMADLQTGVGDGVKDGLYSEGSVPHALLHGAVGCAAAEGLGGNCASGAAAGIAQSVFAGLQEGAPKQQPRQSDDEYFAVYNGWKNDVAGQANLLDAVAEYATFGGQVADLTNAATTAQGKEEFSVILPGMLSSACSYTDQ